MTEFIKIWVANGSGNVRLLDVEKKVFQENKIDLLLNQLKDTSEFYGIDFTNIKYGEFTTLTYHNNKYRLVEEEASGILEEDIEEEDDENDDDEERVWTYQDLLQVHAEVRATFLAKKKTSYSYWWS